MTSKDFLANISQDFYISQLSLAEISEKYGISRYLVNKYLDDARNSGIVKIEIATPTTRNVELERQIQQKFNLSNVYVIRSLDNPNDTIQSTIDFAAKHIESLIHNNDIIGTSWGGTIYEVISKFQNKIMENITFTQFMGENMKYQSSAGTMRMVERAAKKFSANYHTMVGPLYIINDMVRDGLANEISNRPAFAAARRMDMVFTGLGTLASINSIPAWHQSIDEIFKNVNTDEIVGMIYGRPYDINGRFLNLNNDKTFGVDLDSILATPRRISIVKSKFKTNATLGALRGGFITDLITTESVANRILTDNQN
ncbi:sugar-binding transcriptional regulator [Weissella bombi]|uniref:DNA-binding transcriptional regulator LsrR, DeoR family n=1 Tax=Weissella bombi TaxID=1505725 RepID=A0A1C3YZ53_9LACO|nr:sugar-binding domain-containing protein [Weissella bombi]SCB75386.1 DNA-binding transcriptional regulator LsrR, DeoR family [Weissella bombi]